MKHLWEIHGKGRCKGTVAHVLGETEEAARARLLREDASPFFEIDRVELFAVQMTVELEQIFFQVYLTGKVK